MAIERIQTTCVYCGVGCQMILKANDGKIVQTLPADGPGKGKLCIKGWSMHEWIQSPDRLTSPLIRNSRDEPFKEVSWDEAFDFIAERTKKIVDAYTGDAFGVLVSAKCTNEDNYVLQKLARAVLQTNNVDHCARLCHSSTVTGLAKAFGSGAMTNSIDDFDVADLFFITGSNPTEQHPLIGSRIVKAVARGKKVIVADPRDIDIAKLREVHPENVIYIRQKIGTDVALLNGLMNIIIQEGLHDEEFIKERTENFETLKEKVKEYTPSKTAEITGVAEEDLKKVAKLIGETDKVSFVFAMGITQHTTGVDNVLSVANLAMLTGNIGRPGTGVNPLRGQNNVQGACDMGGLVDVFPGYQKVADPSARAKFAEHWKVPSLSDKPGLTVVEITNNAGEQIKGMYIMGENPMITDPDINHLREAFGKLDLMIVQDIFMTETGELADVVLPSASFAERDGTFTNTERRVQRTRKVIDPPGEAKPDWWIVGEIAKRLGYDHLQYQSVDQIMDEIAELTPIYGGIVFDRLEEGTLQWPCPTKDHPGTPYLHKGQFSRGLGSFNPADYKPPYEKTDQKYPFVLNTGRVLHQYHSGTMTRRSPTLVEQGNEAFVELNPKDAEKLGVVDQEMVKVSSRRGEISLKARVSEIVDQGEIFIPFHYAEAAANALTIRALDPSSKIPEFKACACRIEKY